MEMLVLVDRREQRNNVDYTGIRYAKKCEKGKCSNDTNNSRVSNNYPKVALQSFFLRVGNSLSLKIGVIVPSSLLVFTIAPSTI